MKILIKTPIENDFREVFKHFNLELFNALRPPLVKFEVTRFDGCKKGDEVHLKIAGIRWVSHITELYEDDNQIYFIDLGVIVPPPIKSWKHTHKIERTGKSSCMVVDDIEYSTGNRITDRLIYPAIFSMINMRKPIYKRELS